LSGGAAWPGVQKTFLGKIKQVEYIKEINKLYKMKRACVSGTVYGKCIKEMFVTQKSFKTLGKQAKTLFPLYEKTLRLHGFSKPLKTLVRRRLQHLSRNH